MVRCPFFVRYIAQPKTVETVLRLSILSWIIRLKPVVNETLRRTTSSDLLC
ncbi:hypothetical protein BH20ACI3_BH20ACI3_03490 [soil metagenome]